MSSPSRRAYVDWARGLAVLLMIEAHTIDAWTRASDKHAPLFRDLTILGGFAAPLFLWLAGVAVVLSATRTAERTGSRAAAFDAVCRRGLEIFILAFLFRLQAFVVSPGSHPVTLFRVDILNVMGPAIAVAAVIWVAAATTAGRVTAFAVAALVTAMVTPMVRATPLVDALPIWIQWYLRPAGDFTTFTLFPWTGFVFSGGVVGALIAEARDPRSERRLHLALAATGALLVAIGLYTSGRPSIYAESSFWTSSPTWFAIRVGIVMIALASLFTVHGISLEITKSRNLSGLFRVFVFSWQTPLASMGRASLFIYWIHVELVYGYASWLWRHRLPLWGTAVAYVAFSLLMFRAIVLRDGLVSAWRIRQAGPAVQTARRAEAASEASA